MSGLSSDEMLLLRRIRDHLNRLAIDCRDANARGFAITLNIDTQQGVATMQANRLVPVNIEEA